jgi:hypothetical protein
LARLRGTGRSCSLNIAIESTTNNAGSLCADGSCAPHTFNDQFKARDVWDEYFRKIEQAVPEDRAIAVTDYIASPAMRRYGSALLPRAD